ncbi:hypothetical protein [Paenibacillus sp. RC343]|uniref:hypothetical protein n=1 Tax=Paenibacillus sp. RC343 TaxID=3045841 RepID=UPI0024B9EAF4|nr:hypothetical protein [Paenibacillus sp. RC343]
MSTRLEVKKTIGIGIAALVLFVLVQLFHVTLNKLYSYNVFFLAISHCWIRLCGDLFLYFLSILVGFAGALILAETSHRAHISGDWSSLPYSYRLV